MDTYLKGETISILGVLLVVTAWRYVLGVKIEEISFTRNVSYVGNQLPWVMYSLGLFFEVGRRLASLDFGQLSQIISIASSFGVASIFLLARQRGTVTKQVAIALVLGFPLTLLAFGSGMKESILLPLFPAGIIYWLGYRGLAPKTIAVVFGVFVLAMLQLYVGYVREVAWYSGRDYSTLELISGFVEKLPREDIAEGTESISIAH